MARTIWFSHQNFQFSHENSKYPSTLDFVLVHKKRKEDEVDQHLAK